MSLICFVMVTLATDVAEPFVLVDLNTADSDTLQALPDMTPAVATSIVHYRNEHGPFADVRGLAQVPSVNDDDIDRWLPWLVADTPAMTYAAAFGAMAASSVAPPQGFLHLHRATDEDPWQVGTTLGWRGSRTQGQMAVEQAFARWDRARWGMTLGTYQAAFAEHLTFAHGAVRSNSGLTEAALASGLRLAGRPPPPPLWGVALRWANADNDAQGVRLIAFSGVLQSQTRESVALGPREHERDSCEPLATGVLGLHVSYAWDTYTQGGVTAYGNLCIPELNAWREKSTRATTANPRQAMRTHDTQRPTVPVRLASEQAGTGCDPSASWRSGAIGLHGRVGTPAHFVVSELAVNEAGATAALVRAEMALTRVDLRAVAHRVAPNFANRFTHPRAVRGVGPRGHQGADIRTIARWTNGTRLRSNVTLGQSWARPWRLHVGQNISHVWARWLRTGAGVRLTAGDSTWSARADVTLGIIAGPWRTGVRAWATLPETHWREISVYASWTDGHRLQLQGNGGWRSRNGRWFGESSSEVSAFALACARCSIGEAWYVQARFMLHEGLHVLGVMAELHA